MNFPPYLNQIVQLSLFFGCLWVFYLMLRLMMPLFMSWSKPRNPEVVPADVRVAVLCSEMETVKDLVKPLNELVADVAVVVDAIKDLRGRVSTLERERRGT